MATKSLKRENKKSVENSKRKIVVQQHRITGPRLPVAMHQIYSLSLNCSFSTLY